MSLLNAGTILQRWLAPLLVLLLVLTIVYVTLPEELPPWRSISIISAWGGSALLAASLLLMVREPHLAQFLGGLENMYRWHHRCGVLAYTVLLLHPLALGLDSWLEAPALAWQMLAPWHQSWPVWLGWSALILLMLGLISTFIMRLPYRLWRHLHFSLGLAVLLGMSHIYTLLGGVNLLLVLSVITSAALLWRMLISDLGIAAQPYRVAQIEHPASGMIEILLVPLATRLHVAPGQFVLAAFQDGAEFHGCGEYHPFTVSAIHADGSLSLSIKAFGPCTKNLQLLTVNILVRLQGPFGNFFENLPAKPQLWVAGGIGITPFIAELRSQLRAQSTTLLYFFRSNEDAAFLGELETMTRNDDRFTMVTHSSDQGLPDIPAMLDKITGLPECETYICGPRPMVDVLLPELKRRGIPAHAIHFEKFDFR